MKMLSKAALAALDDEDRLAYHEELKQWQIEEEKERVDAMTDAQVLKETNNGVLGPAVVGERLAFRARAILKATGGGKFGTAITSHDPEHNTENGKEAVRKRLEAQRGIPRSLLEKQERESAEPTETKPLSGPEAWQHVTLSGAKVLAQRNQVSHIPRVTRTQLIASLVAAGVAPPEVPAETPDEEE